MYKEIYIKTEPGGKVSFGRVSDVDIRVFRESYANGALSNDLIYKLKKGIGGYKSIQGIINSGNCGDTGN